MTKEHDYLPISLVAHTQFCERRAWLELNGEATDTSQMQAGHSAHARVDDPQSSRTTRRTAVPLRSASLGIVGRADEVQIDETGTAFLVDYKSSPVRKKATVTPAHRLQLSLQRLCLEEQGHDVSGQAIYFTDHRRRTDVELSEDDLAVAESMVNRTREIASATTSPPPLIADERCSRCSHFSVCLPDEHQLSPVPRRIHVSDPDGQVLHLTVQGSRASIRSGKAKVTKDGETLGQVPIERIHGVIVHGNIDLSSALHRSLLWHNVPVVWCSSTGRVYGFSRPTDGPNGLSRIEQHVLSSRGSLPLAREMIHAKISNQATLLRRNSEQKSAVVGLRAKASAALTARDIPELFGIEGDAAARYFEIFPSMLSENKLHKLGWEWPGRVGRGAADPINVLLNYCYGLLRAEAIRAILACGLDPHAGFLHSGNRNKPALALDLMEEFRSPVADSTVISLINRGEIKASDISHVGGAARLQDSGRRKVIAAFERRIQTVIRHPTFEYEVSWRRAIEVQARIVLGVIDGSIARYEGVKIR